MKKKKKERNAIEQAKEKKTMRVAFWFFTYFQYITINNLVLIFRSHFASF